MSYLKFCQDFGYTSASDTEELCYNSTEEEGMAFTQLYKRFQILVIPINNQYTHVGWVHQKITLTELLLE